MTPSERAVIALKNARDTFQSYGDQHAAKDPPQPHKAAVNYAMVAQINEALLELAKDEVVRSSDVFELKVPADLDLSDLKPGSPIVYYAPPTSPARERLKEFIATLGERDDESFVSYNALLGDLRALTQHG